MVQSHRPCWSYCQERICKSVNGEVESESESDNPEDYTNFKSAVSQETSALVQKKRRSIKRGARISCAKALAERRYLLHAKCVKEN